ncbi:MAG: SusD/RagB family nutrient-binding outer membrane lipoprotein [Bacteroidota bacterium]
MKILNRFILAFLTLFLVTSCEDIVEGLNVNPNEATDAPDPLVLTAAQIAHAVSIEGHANRVVNMWTGYFNGADRQYNDYALYNVNAGNFNTAWNNVYQGTVAQTRLIISRASVRGERQINGIAKLIEASVLATATQRWGDIPVSQVVQPDSLPNPVFDGQLNSVYPLLLDQIDDAIRDLESREGISISTANADIYYSADNDKWLAFAHTLKARLYMDLKDYANAYAEALQGISSADGDLITPHGDVNDGNTNSVYDFLVASRSGDMDAGVGEDGAGEQVLAADLLDPSQPEYRGNAKTDESARFNYVYLDNGADSFTGRLEPNYLGVSTGDAYNGLFARDAGFRVATYAENVLTLAEAGFRTNGFATGLQHLNEFREYMNGGGYIDPTVQALFTFQYDPYEAADFDAGGVANTAALSADDALLSEILEERYVTFIGSSLGWNDLRRTQNDAIGIDVSMVLNRGAAFPQRLIYGQDELNSNVNAPDPVPTVFDVMEVFR